MKNPCRICGGPVKENWRKTCSRVCWAKSHSLLMTQRTGRNASHWKGGQVLINGRVWLYKPGHPNAQHAGKYVARSRYVMARHLRRPLTSSEIVHHINGNVTDDRVSNLVIVTRAAHNTTHHRHPSIKTIAKKRLAALKRCRNQKGQFV